MKNKTPKNVNIKHLLTPSTERMVDRFNRTTGIPTNRLLVHTDAITIAQDGPVSTCVDEFTLYVDLSQEDNLPETETQLQDWYKMLDQQAEECGLEAWENGGQDGYFFKLKASTNLYGEFGYSLSTSSL